MRYANVAYNFCGNVCSARRPIYEQVFQPIIYNERITKVGTEVALRLESICAQNNDHLASAVER